MLTGTIKFFNRKKGFGFIVADETGSEIFFHATGLVNKYEIKENVKVAFEEATGERGTTATNVRKL